MRCKVGDLAVIVKTGINIPGIPNSTLPKSKGLRVGNIVKVIRHGRVFNTWTIEVLGRPSEHLTGWWSIYDYQLRPIRPDDGQDETLRWAGLPNEVAHA